jgi:hypothetical protein
LKWTIIANKRWRKQSRKTGAQNKEKIKSVVFKGILKLIWDFFCIS